MINLPHLPESLEDLNDRIQNASILLCFHTIKRTLSPFMHHKQSKYNLQVIRSMLSKFGWFLNIEGSTLFFYPTNKEVLRRHRDNQWLDVELREELT